MTKLCISSRLLGTQDKNLIINDDKKLSWTNSEPEDAWLLSGQFKNRELCYDTLLELSALQIKTTPAEKYVRMMSQLSKNEHHPWQKLLSAADYSSFAKSIVQAAIDAMDKTCEAYYKSTWAQGNRLLSALRPSKIDKNKLDQFISVSQNTHPALLTFQPDNSGFCAKATYNRLSSRTGRLTHNIGADFLTLKKEHRSIIKSRFKHGSIYLIDFSALEVRVLLYEAGNFFGANDLYDEISKKIFDGSVSRKVIKNAMIATLFGQSIYALSSKINIDFEILKSTVSIIHELFELPKLLTKLKKQYMNSDMNFITNRHGRNIKIDAALDNIFVSSYAQSTGVDVALSGFDQITREICDDKCIPLGIIHDAIVIDCHPEASKRLAKISAVKVDGFDQEFFVKVDKIN